MSHCLPRLTASHSVLFLCYLGLLFTEACLLYHIQGFVNDVFSSDGFGIPADGSCWELSRGGVIFYFPYMNLSLSYLYHYVIIYDRIILYYYV